LQQQQSVASCTARCHIASSGSSIAGTIARSLVICSVASGAIAISSNSVVALASAVSGLAFTSLITNIFAIRIAISTPHGLARSITSSVAVAINASILSPAVLPTAAA
jgi:hypothetical protein